MASVCLLVSYHLLKGPFDLEFHQLIYVMVMTSRLNSSCGYLRPWISLFPTLVCWFRQCCIWWLCCAGCYHFLCYWPQAGTWNEFPLLQNGVRNFSRKLHLCLSPFLGTEKCVPVQQIVADWALRIPTELMVWEWLVSFMFCVLVTTWWCSPCGPLRPFSPHLDTSNPEYLDDIPWIDKQSCGFRFRDATIVAKY